MARRPADPPRLRRATARAAGGRPGTGSSPARMGVVERHGGEGFTQESILDADDKIPPLRLQDEED